MIIPLADLLVDHQEFHSDLQMDSHITIRAGGTLYGCYKQALRELATRVRALRERYFGVELLELEIRKHDEKATDRHKIHARQKRAAMGDALHCLGDTEREFVRFYGQAAAIRERLESQGIAFPLDAATRDKLDREMWIHHLKCRVAVEGFAGGRPNGVTLELIQSLPPIIRTVVYEEVFSPDAPKRLLEWFLSYEVDLPGPKIIPTSEARRLIAFESDSGIPPDKQYRISGGPVDRNPTSWKSSA